jgi:hypothetical protein
VDVLVLKAFLKPAKSTEMPRFISRPRTRMNLSNSETGLQEEKVIRMFGSAKIMKQFDLSGKEHLQASCRIVCRRSVRLHDRFGGVLQPRPNDIRDRVILPYFK